MAQHRSNSHEQSVIEHATQLQQSLISAQNDIDSHKSPQSKWDREVIAECNWLEANFDVQLGSPLSTSLELIGTISREGGPGQNNVHQIAQAILALAKFIGSLLPKDKRKSS